MSGKVWLVGAGPGDAGLMTLRGKQVLDKAEVVVYDALVGQGVLNMIPESARLIFAGKRAGHHYLKQEETNRVLLTEAQKGFRVVRLKGGDPFLFGRGGEELELLADNGIPFEIVPGVTSALAVPAYNGIPVTHRDYCAGVHVITGHRRADKTYDIDFDALVKAGGTLIFLMGIAALPDICGGLISAGMDPLTPAAVLEKGTTAAQRRISAELMNLEEETKKADVRTPAIIVVGKVCKLAERFSWYEKRPLAGVRVLLTRPKELSSGLALILEEKGAEVIQLPAIATVPIEDGLSEALKHIKTGCDWLVFTSPSGVRIFFDKLYSEGDVRDLAGIKTAALGAGTQKALRQRGIKADFLPSSYDGETLGKELAKLCAPGSRILIPRAAIGSRALIDGLESGDGLLITDIPTYDTVYESSRVINERELIESGEADLAVFTSASTVKGFAAAVKDIDYTKVRAVCIGRQTEAAARLLGMKTWVSEKATLESLAECVELAARAIL
ncbi:MAG: uroporphyrinogen-III C-methyltransferase [Oscillospiraceae bacterium]|nr:uroporphyrinogen-III C-methyltransferase [Oscillospiraceae bacterium]